MKQIPEHLIEFAEEIASIRHSPDCKACRNKELKGIEGIILVPKGSTVDTVRGRMTISRDTKMLKTCCGKMGPSDSERLAQIVNSVMEQHAARLYVAAFWGGIFYFFAYVLRIVPAYQWVRGKAVGWWQKFRNKKADVPVAHNEPPAVS